MNQKYRDIDSKKITPPPPPPHHYTGIFRAVAKQYTQRVLTETVDLISTQDLVMVAHTTRQEYTYSASMRL